MKIIRNENGQALIITALSMVVLMGFLALATDVGFLFHDRREVQTAADGAALAGAMAEINGSTSTQVTTSAKKAAAGNGFTDGSNGVTVTVLTPPTLGYHKVSPYVEVDITQASIPTVFMGVLGVKTMSVAARAVAGPAGSSGKCINSQTVVIKGSATINANGGCGIYVGSDLDVTGQGNTIDGAYIELAGSETGHGSIQGAPVFTSPTEPDPWASVITAGDAAASPSTCTTSNSSATITGTLDGGNGVVCFTGTNVNISGATLNNGVFLFEHGVEAAGVGGNTTINNGTLDVYGGVFQQDTNSLLNITAPKLPTGSTQWNNGIAIFVPPVNTQYQQPTACSSNPHANQELMIQFGSSSETFQGYIIAPDATLTLHDQGGSVSTTGIDTNTLCNLSGTLNVNGYGSVFPSDSPLRVLALVE